MADPIWRDTARFVGLPLLFTGYRLYPTRLAYSTGVLAKREEELLLYRVLDITVRRGVIDRLLGLGTVEVRSSDASDPWLRLRGVRDPHRVRDLLREHVDRERARVGVRSREVVGDEEGW